jgi:hypothetical protein
MAFGQPQQIRTRAIPFSGRVHIVRSEQEHRREKGRDCKPHTFYLRLSEDH